MKRSWLAGLSVLIAAAAAWATPAPDQYPVTGADGNTYAVVVVCNTCRTASAAATKQCHPGVEHGWIGTHPCGECLLRANPNARLAYPYDLHFTGTLVDAKGHPLKERFVKLFTTNGWNVRTRTDDKGMFRLRLGATLDRKSPKPLITNLGMHVDLIDGKDANYAMYLVPKGYQPCPAQAAPHSHPSKALKKSATH